MNPSIPQPAYPMHPGDGRASIRGPAPAGKMSFIDKLQTAAVFYVGAWALSPPLLANDWARMVAALAAGLWFLCELSRRKGIFLRPNAAVATALFYFVYTSAITVYADGSGALVNRTQLYIFGLFFLFFQAARRHGLTKYRWMIWPTLLLLAVWSLSTLRALGADAHIARELVRSSDDVEDYANAGVGGYGLVYTALWALPGLFYIAANLPPPGRRTQRAALWNIAMRGLAYAALGLAALLVLRAGYSIAVIGMMLGGLGFLLLRGRAQHRVVRVFVASFVAITVLALSQTSLVDSVLGGLSDLTSGTNYHMKIEDIRASMESDTTVGSVYGRTERYVRSLSLFGDSPFIGVLTTRDVGKHSLILDTFAQFGIIGGLPLLYVIFSVPVMLMRASRQRPAMAGVTFAFLIVVAICAGMNNVSASMGVVAYILMPLAMTFDPAPARRWARARAMSARQLAPDRPHLRPTGAKPS